MDKFSILHNFKDTQFLVDTTYHHNTDEFELKYKFWSEKINGYITAKLMWSPEFENNFTDMFEKFKSRKYCRKFILGTEAKFLLGDYQTETNDDGKVVAATYEEKIKN